LLAARDRHFDYFLKFAEEAAPHMGSAEKIWLDRLETEFDNVRAAWERAIESDAELALRLASALEWFWVIRGNPKEGWTWLTRLLPRTEAWGTSKRRARTLRLAGSLANRGGDTKSAYPLVEASLAIAKAICDKHEVALTLHTLGRVFLGLGNWSEARTCYQDSQALYREVGDAWSGGYTTMGLGQLAYGAGDYESARTLFAQSLSLFRNLGDKRGLLATLNAQGELARLQDDYVRAAAFYTESLQLAREMMDRRRQVVMLENLGYVALHEGDCVRARALFEEGLALYRQCERADDLSGYVAGFAGISGTNGNPLQAAQLLSAVEAFHQALGTVMAPADRKEYDHILAAVRAQLDEATFNAAWAEGRTMTLEQAIEYALKA
jgi:tetratricopeptide (TPR) repeat protein